MVTRLLFLAFVVSFVIVPGPNILAITWSTIDPPGSTSTFALGIDNNTIVGHYSDVAGLHGFFYDGTTFEPYGALPHDVQGAKYVGGVLEPGRTDGFLLDGSHVTFITYPGSGNSQAIGIDGSNIVGYYINDISWPIGTPTPYHGYLYNGTNYTSLDFPNALYTYPTGIDGGNIVGHYADSSGKEHGFLYNGIAYASLDYPGSSSTEAWRVDGSNIVGFWTDSSGVNHGFLYDGTTWASLDNPLGTNGTQILGFDGSNIVGDYIDASGTTHGFLATVPEPCGIVVVLSCLFSSFMRRTGFESMLPFAIRN